METIKVSDVQQLESDLTFRDARVRALEFMSKIERKDVYAEDGVIAALNRIINTQPGELTPQELSGERKIGEPPPLSGE